MKYVIVGNSTAAVGAIEGIRKIDKIGPITVISAENYHTYARPLISYCLAGKVSRENMDYRPADFYQKYHVRTCLGEKASGLNTEQKRVLLANGEQVPYDKLLIATGSKPVQLDIPGMDLDNVFPFYTLDDALQIKDATTEGMKGVVLGAGLTALKAAEALVQLGIETTLVIRSRLLRNFLDADAAKLLASHLKSSGLKLVIGSEPVKISGHIKAEAVMLADDKVLPCDFVISATGIRANTDLAQETPIITDQGIVVDEQMQTNVEGVFAAGDVAQGFDLLLGTKRVIPLLPVAYMQGETAGLNMAGKNVSYTGMGMNAVNFFNLPIISAGLILEGENEDVYVDINEATLTYRKLIFREDCLIGFILVNQIERAGVLTWLIRDKVDTSSFKENLIDGSFSFANIPKDLRKERLSAVI